MPPVPKEIEEKIEALLDIWPLPDVGYNGGVEDYNQRQMQIKWLRTALTSIEQAGYERGRREREERNADEIMGLIVQNCSGFETTAGGKRTWFLDIDALKAALSPKTEL